jgi:hypothetical protein
LKKKKKKKEKKKKKNIGKRVKNSFILLGSNIQFSTNTEKEQVN